MAENPTLPIEIPEPDEPEPDEPEQSNDAFLGPSDEELRLPPPPRPINWNLLGAEEAGREWRSLNNWVNWLRRTYGLPVTIIPPYWHRHPELVWELSALHLHWLGSYDPEQEGSAPIGWHADFVSAQDRLRDWVAIAGTKLDSDRPTRQTVWPGEDSPTPQEERAIVDRNEDFAQFVKADVAARRKAEEAFFSHAS